MFLGFEDNITYNELTKSWIEPKYSMEISFTFFSVNNPDEVINGGTPKFREMGPYVFNEYQKKTKVEFLSNFERVIFRNRRIYVYNESLSCNNCSLNDRITIPNIAFQIFVDVASETSFFVKFLINLALTVFKDLPFVNTTVGNALFYGIEDPLIESFCDYFATLKKLCEIAGVPARINFFTNGTSDGEYMIDTGLKNSENFGKVYMWNGRNTTPEGWWYSPEAREINGTDGELYPPGLWNHQRLNLFNGMLGRSVYIQFETESVFENIPVYQYNFPIELYNWSLPENKGFCDPKTPQYFNESIQPVGCLPSGILDLSSTQPAHARIYLSGSHFYRCSNALYENFIGFRSPDSNVDRTFFEMEPMTGTVINVKQTSQVNLGILSGDLGVISKMQKAILPLFWINEAIHLDVNTRNKLLSSVVSTSLTIKKVGIVTIVAGCLLWISFVIYATVMMLFPMRFDDEEQLVAHDDGIIDENQIIDGN